MFAHLDGLGVQVGRGLLERLQGPVLAQHDPVDGPELLPVPPAAEPVPLLEEQRPALLLLLVDPDGFPPGPVLDLLPELRPDLRLQERLEHPVLLAHLPEGLVDAAHSALLPGAHQGGVNLAPLLDAGHALKGGRGVQGAQGQQRPGTGR